MIKNIWRILIIIFISYIGLGLVWLTKIYITHQAYRDGLPVLGYHSVVSDQDKKEKFAFNPYVMAASNFDKQMQYLHDNNYDTLTMDEVYDYYIGIKGISSSSVVLTFDDGFKNFNTVVKPILEKYHLHATAFVIGSKTIKDTPLYLNTTDLINDQYVSYYSHSYDLHHFYKDSNRKIIETYSLKELRQDFITNETIVDDTYFAYPYGISSHNALTVLKESPTKLAFSYNQNRNMTRHDDVYILPRYNMFSFMPIWYFSWIVE
jgi:peptidoglycan/xylan/chitin deacetylase (PgdA/CDA1 family)